jgi:hypothetical protein
MGLRDPGIVEKWKIHSAAGEKVLGGEGVKQ